MRPKPVSEANILDESNEEAVPDRMLANCPQFSDDNEPLFVSSTRRGVYSPSNDLSVIQDTLKWPFNVTAKDCRHIFESTAVRDLSREDHTSLNYYLAHLPETARTHYVEMSREYLVRAHRVLTDFQDGRAQGARPASDPRCLYSPDMVHSKTDQDSHLAICDTAGSHMPRALVSVDSEYAKKVFEELHIGLQTMV